MKTKNETELKIRECKKNIIILNIIGIAAVVLSYAAIMTIFIVMRLSIGWVLIMPALFAFMIPSPLLIKIDKAIHLNQKRIKSLNSFLK